MQGWSTSPLVPKMSKNGLRIIRPLIGKQQKKVSLIGPGCTYLPSPFAEKKRRTTFNSSSCSQLKSEIQLFCEE